ncbi:MAG: transglycosylase SLT domain-containing protein [Thiohalocapsa sp.]|nr:transglycosylase SLT domain-containing protein [Thiohalocapsa sp.]
MGTVNSAKSDLALRAASLLCIATLVGCAAQGQRNADGMTGSFDEPRTVSAREYGYVRPAADVRIAGAGSRSGYAGPNSADLWDRVRHGRSLGIRHHARVDRAVGSLKRNPRYLTDLNRRARPYLHMIVGELERAGLPAELALLPEIESRYNPRAVSPKSASGMWQFMPYTGKEMGLRQDAWYDGRNDVLASTRGAIAYLKLLSDEFGGDWALALASYNAGPGRVRSAQRANKARGKPTDYWSLNLPRETEEYVPKLLAVASLVRDADRHGLAMPVLENRPALELVEANGQINLTTAARASGVSLQTLRDLNPGLKRDMTPSKGPPRVLVPLGSGQKLRTALAKAGKMSAPTVADSSRSPRGDS